METNREEYDAYIKPLLTEIKDLKTHIHATNFYIKEITE